jgi:hypothetical protein
MKTIISNNPGVALDLAKRIMYSLKVLVIGLFIPFTFIFGISYNVPNTKAESSIHMSKQNNVSHNNNTVDLQKVLSAKNS